MSKNKNRDLWFALAATLIVATKTVGSEFTTVYNIPPDAPPRRVFLDDTQVNLLDGGTLPSTYSSPFHAGRPNRGSTTYQSSNLEVNISGGDVGDWFHANSGSVVNISGGSVAYGFQAQGGSRVNISGGVVNWGFEAYSGSEVNISGGTIGRGFEAEPGSQVTLVGGDFKLNGADLTGESVTFAGTDVLSGTLADGSTIIFSQLLGDNLGEVTLSRVAAPAVDPTPIVVDSEVAPRAIRDGQTLTLEEGGILPPHFTAVNATLNIHGGYINGLAAIGSQVNIGGGDIVGLDSFDAFYGTHVVFCGGGGRSAFNAHDGSTVTVVSGLLTNVDANAGSEVTITGGVIDGSLYAYEGSELTIMGKEYSLDGRAIEGLASPGDSVILDSRDWQALSGTLSDGTAFEFDTAGGGFFSPNFFDQNALLRLTVAIPGDYNGNGQVEQSDLDLVLTNWGHTMAALSSGWIASAPDGPIDQQELDAVLLNWGSGAPLGAASVPEPAAWLITATAVLFGLACRTPRRRGEQAGP